jgi:hypothetical protein
VVVIHPGRGNIALAVLSSWPGGLALPSQQGSAMPPGMEQAPTPEGSPSPHVIPSPPHGPSPPSQEPPPQPPASPSSLVRPRRFELRVIPRTQAIDEAEAALANALVVLVGGNRPTLSPEQVRHHLSRFYAIRDGEVQVKRYSCVDFLLIFTTRQLADRVLHAPPPPQAEFMLIFCRWSRQAGSLFRSFQFKVLLLVSNVSTHVWSVQTIQEIVGSSCLVFEVSPRSLDQSDLSSFLVVVWARHPDLIPTEVGCSVPESVAPFVEVERPLFLRAEEIIHSSCNLLHFRALIRTIEVHGFNPPESSDDDDGRSPSSDSSEEDYPGYDPGRGSSQLWPRVSRSATGISSAGELWPSLPSVGGKVWNSAKKVVGRPAAASSGVSGWHDVLPCLEVVLGVAVRHARREQGGMAAPHAAAGKGPTPGTQPISFQQRTQATVGKDASL